MTDASHIAARLAWVGAIREPGTVLSWSLPEWERVVRLGRRLRLLARLAERVEAAGLLEQVPPQPRRHLVAEQRLSRYRTAAVAWALEQVGQSLQGLAAPCVLLKGAAYLGQDLPLAAGRLPSDVDILVPKDRLPAAQLLLREAGWTEAQLSEHDRRYYYEWSHEVPPMVHAVHPIELDLHHDILPPTARTTVDIDRLLARLGPSKWPGWQVLEPADQVLHAAAHLFFDSELRDRLRDLVDLDGLFRHFGARDGFWERLVERAHELGLTEPLALAVGFCCDWLGTPVPAATQAELLRIGPSGVRRRWLTALFGAVLSPLEPDDEPSFRRTAASWVILARYHHWRMPLRLLVPHLLAKGAGGV